MAQSQTSIARAQANILDVDDVRESGRGVKGQKGQKGDKGLVFTGYTSGGSAPPQVNTIDSFPFTTQFITATDVGDLSQARNYAAGQSSSNDGYTSGGRPSPPINTNMIDSFPFSAPFTTATDVGDISQARLYAAGQNSDSDGYTSGGATPSPVNTIDSFPFSSPFTTAGDIGNLSQTRSSAAGQSSSTEGYSSGGFISPAPAPTNARVNTIDSFPFSTSFSTATDVGDLSQSRNIAAGQSSSNDGYTSGGLTGGPPFVQVSTIDSFPFSTPFTTASDVGDLSQARQGPAGQSSSTDGYTSGGQNPPFIYSTLIESFPFSTPFTTATDVGDLSQGRSGAAGQQG